MSFRISWEIQESQTSHISSHTLRWMAKTKTKAHVSLMSKCFKHAPTSFSNYGGEVPWFGILVIEWVPKVMQNLTWPNCAKQLSISIGFEKSLDGPLLTMKILRCNTLSFWEKFGTICMAIVFVLIFTKILGQRNQFWCKDIWYKENKVWSF